MFSIMTKTKPARTTMTKMTRTKTTMIKSTSGQERCIGYLPMGGTKPNVVQCPPGRGRKVTTTRMMMTCLINKDVDNNVDNNMDNDVDKEVDSDEEYNDDGHSRYWGWTRVLYPIVLLCLKDIDNNVKSDMYSDDGSNKE